MPGVESAGRRRRIVYAACLMALVQLRCALERAPPAQGPASATTPSAAPAAPPPTIHDPQPATDLSAAAPAPEQARPDSEQLDGAKEAVERERQKKRAIALVHQLPEVRTYCPEVAGCALVESEPSKGCIPDDAQKRACAWAIAIAHVEPSGPHLSYFARFYVRNNGQLFVEPIQTGEIVGVREWRCLQRHGYEVDACATRK